MIHLGLFAGIGGFELAANCMRWETKAWCEINPFCQKILKYHFPEAEGYEDITKTDFTKYANKIDILTGGFPCQPYSLAGKRKGKEDERHLWPEMLRTIREVQPRWVVGENVFGLVNWDGGLVFHEVQTDLETEGYEVQPFILPAAGVNAPHRRDRIWFVAYNNKWSRQKYELCTRGNLPKEWNYGSGISTDTNGAGQQEQHVPTITERERYGNRDGYENSGNWKNFPTQSPVCGGNDGLPTKLDGITFSKWRNESIKAFGNAIVPQVALQIFKAIEHNEK